MEVVFVEAPGDAADAEAVLEVEAEDVADDGAFIRHDDEAAPRADAVAVRRAAERLSLDGLPAHRCFDAVAEAAVGAELRPGLEELAGEVGAGGDADDGDADGGELEVAAGGVVVAVAQRGEVGHDDEEEPLRALLAREFQELAEAGIFAVAVGV